MSSNSRKVASFISEPLGNKPATALGGIGEKHAGELRDHGFRNAAAVVGHYMALNKNDVKFKQFLNDVTTANNQEVHSCLSSVKGWCSHNL